MKEPRWLTERMVTSIHDEAIAIFGGLPGLRDAGLLDSALNRPKQVHAYTPRTTIFQLAALLCIALAKNHPFLDGNKRTALLSTRAFLFLNGFTFEPPEEEEVETMVAVAAGTIDQPALAKWFQRYATSG